MLDDFFVRAVVAGVGIALVAAPLGCFLIWRGMSFFGETIAHAAILGIALSFLSNISTQIGIVIMAILMAVIVEYFKDKGQAQDTSLGVLSHSSLAIGLVIISFIGPMQFELTAYLLGDILAVTRFDVMVIWAGAALIFGCLIWRWQAFLTSTVSAELAHASGLSPKREHLFLTILLAIMIAISIKLVGVLLIAGLLIIPAAAARFLSSTAESMACIASILALIAVTAGMQMSLMLDSPAGPSIISCIVVLFIFSSIINALRRRA